VPASSVLTREKIDIPEVLQGVESLGATQHLSYLGEVSPDSYRHSLAVGNLVLGACDYYGVGSKDTYTAGVAAVLHDIGKANPEVVGLVNSEHELTDNERQIVAGHTFSGQVLLCGLYSQAKRTGLKELLIQAEHTAGYHHTPINEIDNDITTLVTLADRAEATSGPLRPYQRTRLALKPHELLSVAEREVSVFDQDPLELIRFFQAACLKNRK